MLNRNDKVEKKIQLFCMPYAGGKAQVFTTIFEKLSPDIDFIAIEYAGKGSRSKEEYFSQYAEFIDDITNQINCKRNKDIPYALFGYSIGALFAYDLAVKQVIKGDLKHIFLGGCYSVDKHNKQKKISNLEEDAFWDEVISMGGVKKELVENRKFLKLFSKSLRADFNIGEQYSYDVAEQNPNCDATILYSENDTSYELVSGWANLFNGLVEFEKYDGDHFFAFDNYERTAEIINNAIKR